MAVKMVMWMETTLKAGRSLRRLSICAFCQIEMGIWVCSIESHMNNRPTYIKCEERKCLTVVKKHDFWNQGYIYRHTYY